MLVNEHAAKAFPKHLILQQTLQVTALILSNIDVECPSKIGKSVPDNRHVIHYNPYLVKKFDCHINVESCHNIKAVKYIYKYIYKGYDKGALRINEETPSEYNKINEYHCHINVESCHNIKAVKYIYKYIYKGYDKGALRINEETPSEYNKINEYV